MTTTPTGNALWLYQNDIEDMGGHLDKKNLFDIGSFDSQYHISAEQICQLALATVGAATLAPLCVIAWNSEGIVTKYRGLNGVGIQYAPTVTHNVGYFSINFPSTWEDAYGRVAAVAPIGGTSSIGVVTVDGSTVNIEGTDGGFAIIY